MFLIIVWGYLVTRWFRNHVSNIYLISAYVQQSFLLHIIWKFFIINKLFIKFFNNLSQYALIFTVHYSFIKVQSFKSIKSFSFFWQSNSSEVIAMSSTELFSLITFTLAIMNIITLTKFDSIKFKFQEIFCWFCKINDVLQSYCNLMIATNYQTFVLFRNYFYVSEK